MYVYTTDRVKVFGNIASVKTNLNTFRDAHAKQNNTDFDYLSVKNKNVLIHSSWNTQPFLNKFMKNQIRSI